MTFNHKYTIHLIIIRRGIRKNNINTIGIEGYNLGCDYHLPTMVS